MSETDDENLLSFPGRPRELMIPQELDDPDELYHYLLQHYDCFSQAELYQLTTLIYRERKDITMLVPEQRELVREEIGASGQSELSYVCNLLYRKFFLGQEVETALPCGIEIFTTTRDPDGVTMILTPNENRALFREPERPDMARPDLASLSQLGIVVHAEALEYRLLQYSGGKLRTRVLATPAFQAWFDQNLWLAESLVFLRDEMVFSARTRFFRFEIWLKGDELWNECYDAVTGSLVNMSPLARPNGQPEQLAKMHIYFDDAHAAFLHASDLSFSSKIVPFR